jgi:hypothetical protein
MLLILVGPTRSTLGAPDESAENGKLASGLIEDMGKRLATGNHDF